MKAKRLLTSLMLACVFSTGTASAEIDPVDLAAFLDGVVEARMDSYGVSGTTISVVHKGEVIFAKGYGVADRETGRPVDPNETLFRPGSISKTFTWTAVMQLVEQGELDLDADLRNYVDDVPIPDDYGVITMKHLMTHTPGLEDRAIGHLFENNPDEILTLQEYLTAYPTEQVRAPGTVVAYSNWGTALAGHVVATISGIDFDTYVEQNVLHPIGMMKSTFREPWGEDKPGGMSPELEAQASKGYNRDSGGYAEGDYEFIHQVGPAGGLSTTARDMTQYMLMHLNDGSLNGVQILQPETARSMQAELGVSPDEATGWAHGMIVHDVAGYAGFGHAGGTLHFLSDMIMIPELDLGMFISSNTPTGANVMNGLLDLIVKRYYEDRTIPSRGELDGFEDRAAAMTGNYVSTRRSYKSVEALIMAISGAVAVSSVGDGEIVLGGGQRFVEVEPWVFRESDGSDIFRVDVAADGNVIGFPATIPAAYFEKVGFFGNPSNLLNLLALSMIVFLFALVGTWLRRKRDISQTASETRAAMIVPVMAGLWLAWLIFTIVSLAPAAENLASVMYTFPTPVFKFALVIAIIASLATFAAAALVYPVWRDGSWPMWRRVRHTAVAGFGLIAFFVLNHFNVIGFNY